LEKLRGFEKISMLQWAIDGLEMSTLKTLDDLREGLLKEVKQSYEKIILPKRATAHSAGSDVFATSDIYLVPGDFYNMPTGWKAYMLPDEVLKFYPRSGLGFKFFIRLANTVGIGDSDYYNNEDNEGHYWVKIRNEGNKDVYIEEGQAIAQCMFEKYLLPDGETFEGNTRKGGFGSTTK
jgi:dUTP pyrophosphatase